MPIGGTSSSKFGVTDSLAVGAFTVAADPRNELRHAVSWTDGDGADQAEDNPTRLHTLTGGSDAIDLAGGFTRLDGTAITPTAVKELYLHAPAANAGNVTASFDDANGWAAFCTGDLVLRPGTSVHLLSSHAVGYAVTAGTADLITVTGTAADTLRIGLAVNV